MLCISDYCNSGQCPDHSLSFESLYGAQFTLLIQVKSSCNTPLDATPQFQKLTPLFIMFNLN